MEAKDMQLTAEISMYPLRAGYEAVIIDFIHRLRAQPGVEVVTNQLSTQLRGSFTDVHAAIGEAMRETMQNPAAVVFVVKYVNAGLDISREPDIG
jgi:uncharacterized protein YqgV (UPF0045/DUF77 family)